MNNNIQNTKNKLSIIFSIIVFLVIFVLGLSYFSIKYIKFSSWDKKPINNMTLIIESWKVSPKNIIETWKRFESLFFNEKKQVREKPLKRDMELPALNYLLLDRDKKLISSNINSNIKSELIKKVLYRESYLEASQENGFIIKKFNLKTGEIFIVFNKMKYSFNDYLGDIIFFILINIFFSIFIYFIWKKFVDKSFIPVEQNIYDMKNFIHNAWHELKTPISVLDSNLQLIWDIKKYDKEMNLEMRNEVKKLNSLIDWLIELSDIDSFKNKEENNLKEIILDIEKDYKKNIEDKEIKVDIKMNKDVFIDSNKNYLHIFLSNLIWNAVKYNINSWKINIIFKNNELIIKDTWIWIDKENIKDIFERFYKIDKSRNSEWFGIWLSLVKKIADVYKWKIVVESIEWKGTEFRVKF